MVQRNDHRFPRARYSETPMVQNYEIKMTADLFDGPLSRKQIPPKAQCS